MFYVNNDIYYDQFNQLYDLNLIEKSIKNANVIAYKLAPALKMTINNRLEVAREKEQKKEELVKSQKEEAIAVKWRKTKGRISLYSSKEDKSDIEDDINPDQANNKYLLQI